MEIPALLARARTSAPTRWLLNALLRWKIPFNQPHGLRLEPMKGGGIKVHVPYWRINRNHIRGIHACALATAAEYCCGVALLEHLDPDRYRLIMKTLHMEYHYQARTHAFAVLTLGEGTIAAQVTGPLRTQEAVLFTGQVEVHDVKNNHLATARITWQVKAWDKVRTKR